MGNALSTDFYLHTAGIPKLGFETAIDSAVSIFGFFLHRSVHVAAPSTPLMSDVEWVGSS